LNILIDPLPDSVAVDGQEWPIHTEFYVWVLFEITMQDKQLSDTEKIEQAVSLCFPTVPPNLNAALDALLRFYRCGADAPQAGKAKGGGTPKKAYCFEQDADLIYASFMACYGIDLAEVDELHWWKFRALFRGLPQECEMVKVMGYRTADLKGMGKAQKKFYEKMRKLYALENTRSVESAMSLAERNQRMKDYVARRFAEAGL
jgi:hypothetical protein